MAMGFSLELPFLEAEQEIKQLADSNGHDIVGWKAALAPPPSSSSRGTIPEKVYDLSVSTPIHFTRYKSNKSAQTSSHPDSQAPHPPSCQHLGRKRLRPHFGD